MKKGFFFGLAVLSALAAMGCNIQTHLPDPDTAGEADLRLNKSFVSLALAGDEILEAQLTCSAESVVWVSSNNGVASVDGYGKVTARGPGSAVIIAAAGSKTASCQVKVAAYHASSAEDFAAWLAAQPANTAASPYHVKLTGAISLTLSRINFFSNAMNGKFVSLDLSDCTDRAIGTNTSNVFQQCIGLTEVILPSSITYIGPNAFLQCSNLTQINLPEGITTIGDAAFNQCTSLTQVTLPSSLVSLGGAFAECPNLTQINFPEGLRTIGNSAFSRTGLTQAELPSSLVSLGSSAFNGCSSLTQVTLPASLVSIGAYVFNGCTNLTRVILPEGLAALGESMFQNCTGLEEINLPSSLVSVNNAAFAQCTNLARVTLPEGLRTIGVGAFTGCTSLTQITLPSTIQLIGSTAFRDCSNLTQVTCKAVTPPTLVRAEDFNYILTALKVPGGSVNAYRTAGQWSAYADQVVSM